MFTPNLLSLALAAIYSARALPRLRAQQTQPVRFPQPAARARAKSGWTDARYRRAALKKRNQARHRAACRR